MINVTMIDARKLAYQKYDRIPSANNNDSTVWISATAKSPNNKPLFKVKPPPLSFPRGNHKHYDDWRMTASAKFVR